jgi:hypothetical protein
MTDSILSLVGGLAAAIAIAINVFSAAKSAAEILELRRLLRGWIARRTARIAVIGPDSSAVAEIVETLRHEGYLGTTDGAVDGGIVVLVDPSAELVGEHRGREVPTLVLTKRRLDVALGDDLLLANHVVRLLGDLAVVVSRYGS